jgi:hypothetical protein
VFPKSHEKVADELAIPLNVINIVSFEHIEIGPVKEATGMGFTIIFLLNKEVHDPLPKDNLTESIPIELN